MITRTLYRNPRNQRIIIAQALSILFFISLSIVILLIVNTPIAMIPPLLLAVVLFVVFTSSHLRQYPVEVAIGEQGIEMIFAKDRVINISYTSIADMYVPKPGSDKRYASLRRVGNPYPVHVSLEIAAAIDSSFSVKNGHAIPRWNGRKESKVRGR